MARLEPFERNFRVISYLVAVCGLGALFASGAIGLAVFAVFLLVTVLAWKLEDTRWQVSERMGVAIILIAIPLFILDWRFRLTGFGGSEMLAASSLAKLILFLLAIKLLQKKGDRDWVFIYLISFFQILLAAGISISPLYLVSLITFLLLTASAIIAFEIRKTAREVHGKRIENLGERAGRRSALSINLGQFRLPVTSVFLIAMTGLIAVPLFFVLPRVGGAGVTGGFSDMTRLTGFSDSVTLGTIGRLQQSNETVMRVRIDRNDNPDLNRYYWRGVALDRFENNTWSRSNKRYREPFAKTVGNRFVVDFAKREGLLTVQTVYLEPLNTSVLFAMPRPIVINSGANEISKDAEGGFNMYPAAYERTSYTVYSDTYIPPEDELRRDNGDYTRAAYKYLLLPPRLDPRIEELASDWIRQEKALTRYDIARAVEKHLQNDFGYTLEMKAGGEDPLADFLFNVREGHCEYFATAMAVMLRSEGIATRVVNGFSQGEYNETAGVYVVRQKNAHSWVEVYFPETETWVPFDPTPFAGRNLETNTGGFFGSISNYFEALETFWIQYFVTYDDQEQRSLFRTFRENISEYQDTGTSWLQSVQAVVTRWWQTLRGDEGLWSSARAAGAGLGILIGAGIFVILLVWLWRKTSRLKVWKRIAAWFAGDQRAEIIGFYARLQEALEKQGLERKPHQSPLEFAYATGFDEAVKITEKYNGVRFGEKKLSKEETELIEQWFEFIETTERDGH